MSENIINELKTEQKEQKIELSKKLLRIVGQTNAKYSLFEEGDKILLGLSGGKDSLSLAHILKHFESEKYEVQTIPGITSFCASASLTDMPLCLGDEPLLILPGRSIDKIKDEKYVVVMKVYKLEEKIINVLEEKGFNYVLVSRAGRDGQKILHKKEDILNHRDYMSLIIANRE